MTADSIASLAFKAARRFRERHAISFVGGRSLSFADIDELAGRFAGGLKQLGVCKGERVILHLPNSWEWVIAYHALARIGAVIVPANIALSRSEVVFMAQDSGAVAAILPADRADLGALPNISLIAVGDPGDCIRFEALLETPWTAPYAVDPKDLCTIGYTSGTTGAPKGAMLTHENVFNSISNTATIHVRCAQDRIFSALPLPHVYGNIVLGTLFLTGASATISSRFDASETLRVIDSEKVTLFEGVPTMYYQLLNCPDLDGANLSSLTRCTVGGQTMPVAAIDSVVERFGCPMLELWGMTEVAGPAISHSPYWPSRHGSIGLPFPGTEVRLADLDDRSRDADPGTAGELLVRGPLVTSGYWNNEVATAEAIDAGGWLATGDVALREDDGYLRIVDRRKDMIITAGYNVYPAELEAAIATHPAVAMVGVCGAPDEEKGELAHAFVVRANGRQISAEEIVAYCRERLAAYKLPRVVHFVDDLPKTSSGKILRRALQDMVRQQGG